jgi:uncharacterized protein (TIGR03000 family)
MSKMWPYNVQGIEGTHNAAPFSPAGVPCPGSLPIAPRPEASVSIEVRVPPDAQVWVNGALTAQVGTVRRFLAPAVTPRPYYGCEIRADWREGGRAVSEVRQFSVQASQQLSVDFTSGMPAAAK